MRVALDHVGLSVAELEAAEGFYGRAFGFTRQHSGSVAGVRAPGPIEAHATRGYNHFALVAPDIDELFAAALAAGATAVIEPRPSPEPGVRFAFLADPEGNLVELVEQCE